MININGAREIKNEVRDFYAHGVKSSNKVYATSPDEHIASADDLFKEHFQAWENAMKVAKAFRRNNNMDRSDSYRQSPCYGESYYDFGKRIYDSGARNKFASGNCGEMVAVAAVVAIDDYHCDSTWVYRGHINDPGDHVFCFVSDRKPSWGTVSEMFKGFGSGLCIDPWLNIACRAQNYEASVKTQVKKWALDGKRISWNGADGQHPGWYLPDGTYAEKFFSSSLTFIPVMEPI